MGRGEGWGWGVTAFFALLVLLARAIIQRSGDANPAGEDAARREDAEGGGAE